MQIGKAAFDQGANEVQAGRRMMVALNHAVGIRFARGRCGFAAIDEIAPVHRQGLARHRLEFLAARLGVLAGNTAQAHHGLPRGVGEHKAHLQQNLQFGNERLFRTVGKTLRAVAALQDKTPALGRLGQGGV